MSDQINHLTTHSPEETQTWAEQLAITLRPGSVLALHGNLGAGKTCLVQGLARGLGVVEPVTSPTYTILHEYESSPPLVHVDAYRLSGEDEAEALGFLELLDGQRIIAVEWADRIDDLLPDHVIDIWMEPGPAPDDRLIRWNIRSSPLCG
ncbi:MAG TPA: tRNA (adenosine(37)-N6)-threonylcarbamoyltransferase complex ATPase subunit type 1 TsaE [Kiritimatiellia bacterium]|nr:tRNA (adenosine(37)-N6)-threonylcarbamoyltransferase complex ATPase subunit type 1 TsaE [Kiritimatiellia bacterium]